MKPVNIFPPKNLVLFFSRLQFLQHFQSFPPQLTRPQIVHDGVETLAEAQTEVRDNAEPVVEMAVLVRGRRRPYKVDRGRYVADHEGQNDQTELQEYFPVPSLDHGRSL